MANVCLPPAVADRFKTALTTGEINPMKLSQMSSEERHALFSKIVGEGDAKVTNALFESKMLLKNQQRGYITWAKKVAGITPETRRDMISRIQRMDKFLNPAEEDQFLKDLAATKLGVDVTRAEASTIARMSKRVEETQAKQKADGTFSSEAERLAYGRAKVDLMNHINELVHQANKTTLKTAAKHPAKSITSLAGASKSIKAALDNSAIFRQGWKTLFTNPIKWQRNARKTFIDGVKEFSGKDVMREVNADIMSRPNADLYKKAKLDVGAREEMYPSSLPEKIPLLGRAFKASESMYTGFLHRQRADIFDKYLDIAKKYDFDVNDKRQLESIGKLVNSLTGRGHLGGLEPAADTVNSIFFSPRFLKSNIDTLTAHQFQKGVTPFVRVEAAKNLVKIITGTAAVMAIANAIRPHSVEFDPRSSDFGKIKIGNTRFDVSGGMSSVATLAARLLTQSSKSGGLIKKFNTGYGSQTGGDAVKNFLENKLSPAAQVIDDLINQKDFSGNKPTLKGEVAALGVPLPITNYSELKSDPKSANVLAATLADALGISVNTYGKSVKNWSTNPTKQQQEFRKHVSSDQFKQANKDYNQAFNQWAEDYDKELQRLSPTEQQTVTNAAKQKIEDTVMKKYGFSYKSPKTTKQQKKHTQQLKKQFTATI